MAMTDQQLLELAAKAAGIGQVLCYESARNCLRIGDRKSYSLWRPLQDDGDAMRLAAYQHMLVDLSRFGVAVEHTDGVEPCREPEDYRRAIVRAAAEIGKAMQEGK